MRTGAARCFATARGAVAEATGKPPAAVAAGTGAAAQARTGTAGTGKLQGTWQEAAQKLLVGAASRLLSVGLEECCPA